MSTIAIVLGYKLNDDASMDQILTRRLDLTLKLLKEESINKIILSGGKPTPPGLKISEASKMQEYLISKGVNKEMIITEEDSLTTEENAKYSIPIARSLGAKKIFVVTSLEHMGRDFLNPINIFAAELNDNDIPLLFYTNSNNNPIKY